MTDPSSEVKLWTKNYITILLGTLLIFIPLFMFLTTFPVYVTTVLHKNDQAAGIMNTVFLLASVIFRPLSGKMADDFGLKNITRYSMLLFLITTILYLCTQNYAILLVIRFFNGVAYAISSTAILTVAAHSVPANRQGEGIGYVGTFMTMGTVIGPFIGLSLARTNRFEWAFIIGGICLLIGFINTFIIKIPNIKNEPHLRTPLRISSLFEKSSISISTVMFIVGIGYASVVSFYPVYVKALNLLEVGSYFFVVYAVFSLFCRFFVGRIYDRFGVNAIAYPAIISFALSALVLSHSHTSVPILISGALVGMGYGSLVPTFQTLAIQLAPGNRKGVATATYYAFLDGGISFGSLVLGSIVGLIGYVNMYVLISFILFGCLGIYYGIHGKKSRYNAYTRNMHR